MIWLPPCSIHSYWWSNDLEFLQQWIKDMYGWIIDLPKQGKKLRKGQSKNQYIMQLFKNKLHPLKDTQINNSSQVIWISNKDIFFALRRKKNVLCKYMCAILHIKVAEAFRGLWPLTAMHQASHYSSKKEIHLHDQGGTCTSKRHDKWNINKRWVDCMWSQKTRNIYRNK